MGLTTTVTANKNLHTQAGDELLAETARLVNNVNIMEHEMINGMSVMGLLVFLFFEILDIRKPLSLLKIREKFQPF